MNVAMQARNHMIDGQLEPNDVRDERIIAAMGTTPRDRFVPELYAENAYVDACLPLNEKRWMMSPTVVARLLEACMLSGDEKVLVIGGGTGYTAMLIAQLGCDVVMVEEQRELADYARRILSELKCDKVNVVTGALLAGELTRAPYDVIVVDGAVQRVPRRILKQLSDNGRLVTVQNVTLRPGSAIGLGHAIRMTRRDEAYDTEELFDASVALLEGFDKEKEFAL